MLALAPSCNKWLEVDNDTNVGADKQFADYEGFRSAVNGVYLSLSDRSLYAENLSWGMVSVLGNTYDTSTGSSLPSKWKNFFQQDYTTDASLSIAAPVWERGYNAIANVNEILVNLENTDDSFFPSTARERDVIKGEMLGVRAMMHLDLLRLFAPAVAADDGKPHIPYVDTYPVKSTTPVTVTKTLERIIEDLKQARELLKYNDTEDEINSAFLQTASRRFHAIAPNDDRFMTMRGLRMNWFAATGILTRAYLWAGELKLAHDTAAEAMDWGPWPNEEWFIFPWDGWWSGENSWPRKMYDNIMMAAWRPLMVTEYTSAFQSNERMQLANSAALFAGAEGDYRYDILIDKSLNTSQRWVVPATATSPQILEQMKLAPIIRFSELQYAMMEYLAGTDLTAANDMLGTMRMDRSDYTPTGYATQGEFLDALWIEMQRELQTEGQTFFLFKRLNRPLYNGTNPAIDMTGRWVLPTPRSENEYI